MPPVRKMLRLDFAGALTTMRAVKEASLTLRTIGDLLVRAGALMEDESVALVSRLPAEPALLGERIVRLEQVASDLSALAAAAQALKRQMQSSS